MAQSDASDWHAALRTCWPSLTVRPARAVLAHSLTISSEAVLCMSCLQDAFRVHGKLEVFNSDWP